MQTRFLCCSCELPIANFYPFYVPASSRRAEDEDDDIKQLAAWAT